jgi:hypothetical protein
MLSSTVLCLGTALIAQTPTNTAVLKLAASTANLRAASAPVRIDVMAWSSDADSNGLLAAWNLQAPPGGGAPRGGAPGARGGAAGGRGGGRGGRGGDVPSPAELQANATPAPSVAPPQAARGGGRGGARGGPPAAAPAPARNTPEGAIATALQSATTLGYVWTAESVGYAIKYARRFSQPDGSQRIILATDRRLGAWGEFWKMAADPIDYGFSVIELRLNATGIGEGKISLTGKVFVDASVSTLALADYASQPVLLKDIKIRSGS